MFGSSDDEDGAPEAEHVGTVSGGTLGTDREISRFVDEEAGVVVYALVGGQSAGLETVPLSETDLESGEWGSRP